MVNRQETILDCQGPPEQSARTTWAASRCPVKGLPVPLSKPSPFGGPQGSSSSSPPLVTVAIDGSSPSPSIDCTRRRRHLESVAV